MLANTPPPQKLIEYSFDRCLYSIQLLNQDVLLISIQPLQQKKRYTLKLDNQLLANEKLNVQMLFREAFNQYIFDSKTPKQLLQFDHQFIWLSFTFPSCRVKSLKFECSVVSLDESSLVMERVTKLIQEKMDSIEDMHEAFRVRIEQLTANKLKEINVHLDQKLYAITASLEIQNQNKLAAFKEFYFSREEEHERKYEEYLSNSVRQVAENNLQLNKEFNFISRNLEKEISTLNDHIVKINSQIKDLDSEIESNHFAQEEALGLFKQQNQLAFIDIGKRIDMEVSILNKRMEMYLRAREMMDEVFRKPNSKSSEIFICQNLREEWEEHREPLMAGEQVKQKELVTIEQKEFVYIEQIKTRKPSEQLTPSDNKPKEP